MNTIQDFTAKLDKINWSKYDWDKESLLSDDGFRLFYTIKLSESYSKMFPTFQVVIQLRYKDSHVMTWGCDSNESQDDFGKWFIRKKADAIKKNYEDENFQTKIGKALFNNL